MNVQCWRFILIKSQENKNLLSELAIGQHQVRKADALIVCIADTKDWERANITNIKNSAVNPALQCDNAITIRSLEQVIYPVSYMMLEAEALGISSCIIGAFGSDITKVLPEVHEKVREKLKLKDGQIISTIITLGYDAETKESAKIRKDFNDVVYLEEIGNRF